ncbi:MAG: hypothetical protein COT74_12230 [Bdellovibrionales bacterium CG10_big_fil_rev_8_21_14_0_10_45_34]|nr:MAG: hypothetical protein COT74_12230 [Bdellovibrionales bacterium CG10_big_fil_rev_8_21_14_0_10_45_34]
MRKRDGTPSSRQTKQSLFCLVILLLAFTGCTSGQKHVDMIEGDSPLNIRFKPQVGQKEVTDYKYHSLTRTTNKGQVNFEREEDLTFSVQAEVLSERTESEITVYDYAMETLRKDGQENLNNMAFPELGEKIVWTLNDRTQVLKVANKLPGSIFYVPLIPIPDKPIKVGDTWESLYHWNASNSQLKMVLELTTLLKSHFRCQKSHECIELQYSGEVNPSEARLVGVGMKSVLEGTMVYDLTASAIVMSKTNNSEEIAQDSSSVEVKSCIVSTIQSISDYSLPFDKSSCP